MTQMSSPVSSTIRLWRATNSLGNNLWCLNNSTRWVITLSWHSRFYLEVYLGLCLPFYLVTPPPSSFIILTLSLLWSSNTFLLIQEFIICLHKCTIWYFNSLINYYYFDFTNNECYSQRTKGFTFCKHKGRTLRLHDANIKNVFSGLNYFELVCYPSRSDYAGMSRNLRKCSLVRYDILLYGREQLTFQISREDFYI